MDNNNMSKNYLAIKEFAELVGMTEHSLRHYDNEGIFCPAIRGTDAANSNYRYYAPPQITTVKMIRTLNEIGVPFNIIKELAQDRSPERLLKVLSKNKEMVVDEIRFLQEVCSVISTFMDLLLESISITEGEISVSVMPEQKIILGDINNYNGMDSFGEYTRFCAELYEPKLNNAYPVGGYFDNMAAFMKGPSEPVRFFSLDPKGNEKKEEGLYLIGYTRGYYGQTGDLPQRMMNFAKTNSLRFKGPVYNIYLNDELSQKEPDQYLLQVSVSVTETQRVSSRRPHLHYTRG